VPVLAGIGSSVTDLKDLPWYVSIAGNSHRGCGKTNNALAEDLKASKI